MTKSARRVLWPSICAISLLLGVGCAKRTAHSSIVLPKGTKLKLMLLTPLEAGKSKVGDRVLFAVVSPVTENSQTLIKEGAIAEAKVTWSRSESSLSAMANQPARLAVRFNSVKAADGEAVPISWTADAAETGDFQFTRANTSISSDQVLKDADDQKLLEEIAQSIDEGKSIDLSSDLKLSQLKSMAQELKLAETRRILANPSSQEVKSALQSLGPDQLPNLLSGQSALVGAVLEIVGAAGQVGGRLDRALRGRTIRAHVGTLVEAFTIAEATVSSAR